MRKIKAIPITNDNFRPYGSFYNMLRPEGNCFPGEACSFYPDPVLLPVNRDCQIAFSAMVVKKPEKMVVKNSEYHNWTGEGLFFIDDDAVLYVAPPSKHVVTPEKTEAFIVPRGTAVKLNTGVWHMAPFPVHNEELHIMVMMPERVYGNDCYICDFPEETYIEIEL